MYQFGKKNGDKTIQQINLEKKIERILWLTGKFNKSENEIMLKICYKRKKIRVSCISTNINLW